MVSKTIWMVSGNKGGVGKSVFCLALASALEIREETFAIFDGDGRTGDVYEAFLRKVPAKWADFRKLKPDSFSCQMDKPYEEIIHSLLSANTHLIINTPDGADNILLQWFNKTLAHAELTNCTFKFMYLMSNRPDGLDMLTELVGSFAYFYPVRNLHFKQAGEFDVFNRMYSSLFEKVINFPVLRSEELLMLFDLKTFPAEILKLRKKNGMHAMSCLSRARLQDWQGQVIEVLNDIIDNQDSPNVKAKI